MTPRRWSSGRRRSRSAAGGPHFVGDVEITERIECGVRVDARVVGAVVILGPADGADGPRRSAVVERLTITRLPLL